MKCAVPYTGPMRFAHRGLVQFGPDNTLDAFRAAVEHGCEGIELDVQLSRDGEIIVAHDANLTRMTLGHPTAFTYGRIREMTWEELSRVEMPYANHLLPMELPPNSRVETMATLVPSQVLGQREDYIDAIARDGRMAHMMRFCDFDAWLASQRDITVEVEVKSLGIMPRMLEILNQSTNVGRYILFSGVPAINEEIQSACRKEGKPAGLRLGANLRYMTEETRRSVREWDLFEIGLNAEHFTQEDVLWLGDQGVAVFSNLGDYPAWWEKLCAMDVMGFKTNYADAFITWWQARQSGKA